MKQLLILFIFLWSIGYNAQKDRTEGEVVYTFSLGNAKDRKEIQDKVADSTKMDKGKVGKIVDLFFSGKPATQVIKFKEDKVLSVPEVKPEARTRSGISIAQIMIEKMGSFYTDLSQGVTYGIEEYNDREIIIKYNIGDLKWNITDETKVINGYQCRKATAKYKFEKRRGKEIMREVVAWFAEDIPIRVAPERFYGLPGLVVMFQNKKMTYLLSSINYKKVDIGYKIDTKKAISEDELMEFKN